MCRKLLLLIIDGKGGWIAQAVNKSCGLGDIIKCLTFALVVYFVISAQQLIYRIINFSFFPFPLALVLSAPQSLTLSDDSRLQAAPGDWVASPSQLRTGSAIYSPVCPINIY